MTTLPRKSPVAICAPSMVCSVSGGAGWPSCRAPASASCGIRALTTTVARRARARPGRLGLERIAGSDAGGPAREDLVALELAVHRQLDEAVQLRILQHADGQAGTQVGDRAGRVRRIGERALVVVFAAQVQLQLRRDVRPRLVAQADADGGLVAGPVVLAGLVELVLDGGLELAVDEGVEVLADRLVIIGAGDQVGAAGAQLQAGVEQVVGRGVLRQRAAGERRRLAAGDAAAVGVGAAVTAARQLDAQ